MEITPGSPQDKKRMETAGRILQTAARVFSEVGYSGARMDEIARLAAVNKATIYYHIGNKEALYGAVLHDVFGSTADAIAQRIGRIEDPRSRLEAYLRTLVDVVTRNPDMPAIMMREMAAGGRDLPEVAVRDIARMFAMLTEILESGVRQDLFYATYPPYVHLMAVGIVVLSRNIGTVRNRFAGLPEIGFLDRLPQTDTPDEIVRLVLRAVVKTPNGD